MSFTKTSRSISVTSDFLLTAECQAIGGQWKRSFLQLDKALGNADGEFRVENQDFSKSASDVVLKEENGSTILHAQLKRRDQSWQKASFNLDAIVANRNGVLCVDTSYTRPPSEAVTCSSLEKLVAECRQTADDLKKQVYEQLAQEASAASQSVNTAFKGIQQMQEVLSDGGAYAYKTDFQQESEHLRFLLRDAVSQWSRMEDAMGAASQQVKQFQDTDLQSVTAEIEAAEKRIAEEVYAAKLKQKEARDHLETLCKEIGEHQKERQNALDQRHDAWARTVGFSIASVVVPFVFIPLAVNASKEREERHKDVCEIEERRKEASCLRDRLDGLQIGLERTLEAATESIQNCERLRAQVRGIPEELRRFEERIHEKKRMLTEFSQSLHDAETDGVMAFQYSETLQEGREIIEELLRVKRDFDPANLGNLLQM